MMNVKVERRTTIVTSYDLDLSNIDINDFKQALSDNESEWISEQFDDANGLYRLLAENPNMAVEIFNTLNSDSRFGDRNEYFLDNEEYFIEC